MRPPSIDFEEIKRTVSISQVLARYTRVPARDKYRIPCPLHDGEGYNFAVDEKAGLFHCFTCGEGGDVVVLLARLEGVSNLEAGKRLAAEFEVKSSGSPSFRAAWNEMVRWQPKQPLPLIPLPASLPLRAYRGYTYEAIHKFGLSRTPNGILIPIRDEGGRIVGYAIRQFDREPKYLNSKDLRKSELVYGLFENKEFIAHRRRVIVCEGQFSAIRVWDSGNHNVVATLGATMSPTQADILSQYVSKVTVLYDGDEAGVRGAEKIREAYSSLFTIDIKHLPEGQDPDGADLTILNETE